MPLVLEVAQGIELELDRCKAAQCFIEWPQGNTEDGKPVAGSEPIARYPGIREAARTPVIES